ncbi:MAG TPA: hypothetical protein VGW79_03280, partial [Actinomycetota bacterium]|nr:hypothetical protein [Actinomycetota bacterium]
MGRALEQGGRRKLMSKSDGRVEVFHLGWRDNGDGLDVALAVNRLLSSGSRAWRMAVPQSPADAGDYLLELVPHQRRALAALGVAATPWRTDIPPDAQALARPAVRLFAGTASKFPYFAYYALCLLRLGIDYVPCDGAALASGTLDGANILILPGGFATWGIDAAENADGADARVRAFLAEGGTAIGSCGGAFYLSSGRPGWTGTASAKPLYTHEYLQSGVGIVTLAMQPGPIGLGCPPTIEVPYYHGPIYDVLGPGIKVAASFHALSVPARLAIDNPLDRDRFTREMAGTPAILSVAGGRGRAILFSPHPEMGDLVRKYIALDGYVRHYLPIRGFETMRDTLRHYRIVDAPSFRLVHNAVHELMVHARPVQDTVTPPARRAHELPALCRRAASALPDPGSGEEADLLRDIAAGIGARIDPAARRAEALMHHA